MISAGYLKLQSGNKLQRNQFLLLSQTCSIVKSFLVGDSKNLPRYTMWPSEFGITTSCVKKWGSSQIDGLNRSMLPSQKWQRLSFHLVFLIFLQSYCNWQKYHSGNSLLSFPNFLNGINVLKSTKHEFRDKSSPHIDKLKVQIEKQTCLKSISYRRSFYEKLTIILSLTFITLPHRPQHYFIFSILGVNLAHYTSNHISKHYRVQCS